LVTLVVGRPLIKLNYDQLDKEASFRSALIHVRENAESIMLARGEARQSKRLMDRFGEVVANFRRITDINRNVGFFTTGYNWLIQIIPALVVAPAFIRGEIDFGAITQSAMAFTALVAAFSLIVTQYQSLSTFAAVVARLSSLIDAIEQSKAPGQSTIEIVEAEGLVAYEGLTLFPPARAEPLLKDLSISISAATRVTACCGDVPTIETLAAVELLRQHAPELKVRVVNIVDLMRLQPPSEHPHGLRAESDHPVSS